MRGMEYSTVVAEGSPAYLAPLDPICGSELRFMVVHRVSGGGWGIVDRRTGRLLRGPASAENRYADWTDAKAAVASLNAA